MIFQRGQRCPQFTLSPKMRLFHSKYNRRVLIFWGERRWWLRRLSQYIQGRIWHLSCRLSAAPFVFFCGSFAALLFFRFFSASAKNRSAPFFLYFGIGWIQLWCSKKDNKKFPLRALSEKKIWKNTYQIFKLTFGGMSRPKLGRKKETTNRAGRRGKMFLFLLIFVVTTDQNPLWTQTFLKLTKSNFWRNFSELHWKLVNRFMDTMLAH